VVDKKHQDSITPEQNAAAATVLSHWPDPEFMYVEKDRNIERLGLSYDVFDALIDPDGLIRVWSAFGNGLMMQMTLDGEVLKVTPEARMLMMVAGNEI
jgi:hypothetical protein